VREAREFRVHHGEFRRHGVSVACVSRESVEANRRWAKRLALPYPLLSDADGAAGRALGAIHRIPIGPWSLELLRRCTLLIDAGGTIAAVWSAVKVRGHALEVLSYAQAASAAGMTPVTPGRPSPPAA